MCTAPALVGNKYDAWSHRFTSVGMACVHTAVALSASAIQYAVQG
jgi:hypothetical protein